MSEVNIWDEINKLYGPAVVAQLKQVSTDQRLAGRIVVDQGAPPDVDIDQVLQTLGDYVKGKAVSDEDFTEALRALLLNVRDRRSYVALSDDEIPPGRRGDLMLEAGAQLIQAKATAPFKLTLVEFDPAAFKADLQAIKTNRAIFEHSATLQTAAYNNNRVVENRVFRVLVTEYGKVRKAALADPDLMALLHIVEKYGFGAAQEGAQTAQDNRAKEAELRKSAEADAYNSVNQSMRQGLANEMQGLVDNLIQNLPGTMPPGTTAPAQTGQTAAGGKTPPAAPNRRGPAR